MRAIAYRFLPVLLATVFQLAPGQGPSHWAWSAPQASEGSIDHFVRARLRAVGLKPAPEADRYTLVRRLHLDLTGLPPTPEEADAFVADTSPDAYTRLVGRLLERPEFGERMAVPWLDAARYADTNGFSIDDHRDMWAWRDWVIRAFNQNMPFDRFITEQLAGDLLPDADDGTRLATGFLRNGMNTHEGGTLPQEYRVIYLADMVDTVSSVFLGLTVRCAQCHDHPYDPVTQEEYYRFYAFFDRAVVRGMGAQNGNTPPVLEVDPPLGTTEDAKRHARARLETLERHRLHPPALIEARAAFEERERRDSLSSATRGVRIRMPKSKPRWIWAHRRHDLGSARFERRFQFAAKPRAAHLLLTCDDEAVVKINGREVARVTDWRRPALADVGAHLRAGDNVLAVTCRNRGGPAGLMALLVIDDPEGAIRSVVSDASWRAGVGDEALRPAVELATYGDAPWGRALDEHLQSGDLSGALRAPAAERTEEQWGVINRAFGRANPALGEHTRALESEIKVLRRLLDTGKASVMVMQEGKARTTYVLQRGQYDQPDKNRAVTPATPSVLAPMSAELPPNRLGLARWLTSPDHPLTARVAVNGVWQMLFGGGLIATANDLGSRGIPPTHPKLLDALARRFVDGGWDVKALIEEIVTSATYRQTSRAAPAVIAKDPDNALLSRGPRHRLSAEAVRDGALAIGGVLVRRLGGPCAFPEQPDGLWREVSHFGYAPAFTAQAFYPSLGDDLRRRGLYTFWKRTSPPPAMTAFDAPSREVCTMQRSRTNTPLQALIMLNAPVFVDAARGLAHLALARELDDTDGRLAWAFRRAAVRPPEAAELAVLRRRLEVATKHFADRPREARALLGLTGARDSVARRAAWVVVASVILNLDEVITKE